MKRMELIAYNFARLRKKQGWTQEECAARGELSKGYIGAVEARLARSFSAEAEEKWAHIFGVSIAEFFLNPNQIIMDTEQLASILSKPAVEVTEERLLQKQHDLRNFAKRSKRRTA